MIGDALENSFIYLNRFNPEKSSNPFAYFTEVIKNAFIQRILIEQKQLYTRYKVSELQLYSNTRTSNSHDGDDYLMEDFVTQYEKLLEDKKQKTRERALKKLDKTL
jgi:DNA-directed RNA polymerase specialized sigma24 family protein